MVISASADTLVGQASRTAAQYLQEAVRSIDAEFGDGFAKKNPQLVAAMINAASKDFHTTLTVQALEGIGAAIEAFSSDKEF